MVEAAGGPRGGSPPSRIQAHPNRQAEDPARGAGGGEPAGSRLIGDLHRRPAPTSTHQGDRSHGERGGSDDQRADDETRDGPDESHEASHDECTSDESGESDSMATSLASDSRRGAPAAPAATGSPEGSDPAETGARQTTPEGAEMIGEEPDGGGRSVTFGGPGCSSRKTVAPTD